MRKLNLLLIILILFGCSKESIVETIEHNRTEKIESLESRILPNGLVVELDNGYYVNGDMLFKPEYVDQVSKVLTRGFAESDVNSYWPNRKVFYDFDRSVDSDLKESILSAMNQIADSSGVVFQKKTPSTKNYVVFKKNNSRYSDSRSEVGMQGGAQDIIIAVPYSDPMTINHEIFHALGFYHEHQRSDRENYIKVKYENIPPRLKHNFDTLSHIKIGPYDLSSIMHYGSFSNPRNDNEALVCYLTDLDGNILPSAHFKMSAGDIQSLRAVYGPPFHRLENVTTINKNIVSGADEIYDAYTETYLRFYADEACKIRMALSYPRTIVMRTFENHCSPSSNGRVTSQVTYQTYTIPAGTDSFFIDSRRNIEYYYYSDGYNIDSKYYSLSTPRHLPDVELIVNQ